MRLTPDSRPGLRLCRPAGCEIRLRRPNAACRSTHQSRVAGRNSLAQDFSVCVRTQFSNLRWECGVWEIPKSEPEGRNYNSPARKRWVEWEIWPSPPGTTLVLTQTLQPRGKSPCRAPALAAEGRTFPQHRALELSYEIAGHHTSSSTHARPALLLHTGKFQPAPPPFNRNQPCPAESCREL